MIDAFARYRPAWGIVFGVMLILWLIAPRPAWSAEDEPAAAPSADPLDDPDANEAAVDETADYWGKIVHGIEYNLPKWMALKEFKNATKIKEGKKLTRWRVRQSIRRLYLVGNIEYPVIKAKTRDDGRVDVIIKVYPSYVVRDVTVSGNKTFNDDEITDEILHLSTGDDYQSTDIATWEEKIKKALSEEGFLKAEVKIRVELTDKKEDNKADVFIEIREKRQFKIKQISFEGSNFGPYSRNDILGQLKVKPGNAYNEAKLAKGLTRLEKWLKNEGRLESQVPDWNINDERTRKIDWGKSEISIFLSIQVGPKVDITWNRECFTCAQRKWKLPKEVGLSNQRRFNEYIVRDWETKVEEYFKKQGYFEAFVSAEYKEETRDGELVKVINVNMDPGPKTKIREIDFKNNPGFNDKELVDQLTNTKYFTEAEFDTDLENVINFYQRNGFAQAKVLEKRLEYIPGEGIYIQIVMEEGKKTILNDIVFEAVDEPDLQVFDRKKLRELLDDVSKKERLKKGDPLNPFLIDNAKSKVIAEYLRKGYIKSRVRHVVDYEKGILTFKIKEGKRYRFGNIYIHGAKLTKKHVIYRELFITPGRPFNYEKIFDSEQALVRLGFFRSVQIRPVDLDITEQTVDLLVEVEERNAGYIETGLGWNSYFGYKAAFEVGHKNLAGHGRRISFHTDVAMRDEHFRFDNRNVAIDFLWPWIARWPLDGTVTLFDNQAEEIGYNLRSFGIVLGVSTEMTKLFFNLKATSANDELQKLWKFWTSKLEYEFAKDFIFEVNPDVEEEPGEILITLLKPTMIRDERNNPFNPTGGVKSQLGSYIQFGAAWSAPALQSQVHYLQLTAQTAGYLSLFQIPEWGHFVFAQNFRAGHGQVLRDTDTIPISRRFYLGGSTTIRGFQQNQIAPLSVDGKTPIGGNFLFQSNTEFRIPLPKNLGILLFFDAGDVTENLEHFYFDLLRTAAGAGFRYITPIGPISLDYGVKLNREPDETIGEFYITIGNAF